MPDLSQIFRKKCLQVFAIVAFSAAAFGTVHADPIIVSGSASLSVVRISRRPMSRTLAVSTTLAILASRHAAGPSHH
jgi:hypothetical protein